MTSEVDLTEADYRALGQFRYRIRRFLHFSEGAARAEGLEPQQHQLLLAVRCSGEPEGPTVKWVADQLFIRHHSAVGLIDRMEKRGLVKRARGSHDRREVRVGLTPDGCETLQRLSNAHRDELRRSGRDLADALQGLIGASPVSR